MKRNDTKEGHDELAEKLKMKQRGFLPFLRELIRAEDIDIEDIEEEVNEKHAFEIQRKESEEELEGEEIEKELGHDEREEQSEYETEKLLHRMFEG